MQKSPSRLPPLDLIAAFESAARHLSFTKAGAERFITQSAMSRQIRALEEDLGVTLFRRRHRALSLTEEGLRLQQACVAALGPLRNAVAALRAPARREVLSLTTTPGIASLWLIPRLASFTREHPDIDVRIDASLERRRLADEGIDIAIRYGPVGRSEGRPLFSEAVLPVCSPRLLKSGPPLQSPSDLACHTLLVVQAPPDTGMPLEWEPWLQAVGLPELQPAAMLSFSGYGEAIAAALAGQGVALGRRPLIDALLRGRKLVTPFRDTIASQRAYFLVVEQASRERPSVLALERWLLQQAGPPTRMVKSRA